MATQWGARATKNGNGIQVGVSYSWSNVTNGSTSANLTVSWHVADEWAFRNDPQTLATGGVFSGSVSYTNNWGNFTGSPWVDSRVVATKTYTYTYPSGSYGSSPATLRVTGTVTDQGNTYGGLSASVSASVAVPARPYANAAQPSGTTWTYNSDTSATIHWSRNSTAGAPYTQQKVWIFTWSDSLNGYDSFPVATISGQATTYQANGIGPNHIYFWGVQAVSPTGVWTSVSGNSSATAMNTTMAAPSNVKARISSDGSSITVSGTDNQNQHNGPQLLIDRSVNGAAFTNVATVTSFPWTDSNPGAGSNQYRVRAHHTVGNSLYSAYTLSNTVSTIVPPLAPTGLSPAGGSFDLTQDLTLTWQHNDGGDGADPTAVQVQYSTDGGTTWTDFPGSAFTYDGVSQVSYVVPGGTLTNGTSYQWDVAETDVASAGQGPMSNAASFTGSAAPTVTVTAPAAGTLTSGHVTAAWTYAQAQSSPQASAVATLYAADGVTILEQQTVTTASTVAFSYYCSNGVSYAVGVEVTSGAGLSATSAQVAFTVSVPVPAAVNSTYTFNPDDGSMIVHLAAQAPDTGQTAVSAASIERSVDGGVSWVRLVHDVDPNSDVLDPLPILYGSNVYRVTSIGSDGGNPTYATNPVVTVDLPSAAVSYGDGLPETLPFQAGASGNVRAWASLNGQWCFLNYGDVWQTALRARHSLTLSTTATRTRTINPFLGQPLPTATIGVNIGRTVSFKATLVTPMPGDLDVGMYDFDTDPGDWLTASDESVLVAYRDLKGQRLFGVLGDVQISYAGPRRADVTFTVTAVDFTEVYG